VWESGYTRKLANYIEKPRFLIYHAFSNKLKFSRGLMALATLTVPSDRKRQSLGLPPHPFLPSGCSPELNYLCLRAFHGLNNIDPHRILTIVGAWPSIMGWMRFLNSDDVVAVLSIFPFQDANAPAVRVAHGRPSASRAYIYGLM
jgi:hypothetical protein